MMSQEKQIEEMAKALCQKVLTEYCASGNCTNPNCLVNAKALESLYNAGYRKQSEGEWVEKNIFFAIYKCSICGAENLYKDGHACLSKFCPNCGAKMKGGAE